MPTKFIIRENNYLHRETIGYYNKPYTGYGKPDNPAFINTLKNIFNNEKISELEQARNTVTSILVEDLRFIMQEQHMTSCLCVSVPRSKIPSYYQNTQLMLLEGIQNAIRTLDQAYVNSGSNLKIIDSTDCIIRTTTTRTTHVRKEISNFVNEGDRPYPGITSKTCAINKEKIAGQDVILIDDLYTYTVNIDEDCIQALYDNGAKNVIFYAFGYLRY